MRRLFIKATVINIFKFLSLPGLTSFEEVEPSDGGHNTEVEFSFLIIVKAWMMSLMVMF